jgi:hypothetical protein
MFEYHGWATIRVSFSEDFDEARVINEVKMFINSLNWPTGVLDLRAVNGEYHLWVAGFDNHKPHNDYDPVQVYGYICKIAPASYGILYVRDDEDINGHENEFRIYAMARGKLTEKQDNLLSPFIPTVEDEYKEE